jgi:translation elongation factor EF-G
LKISPPTAVPPPMKTSNTGIRNIAIIAHGKTTLVDATLS